MSPAVTRDIGVTNTELLTPRKMPQVPQITHDAESIFVLRTLVSAAGEDRGKVLEGFADSLILFGQSYGKTNEQSNKDIFPPNLSKLTKYSE